MRLNPKLLALSALFSRWGRPCPYDEGYTLILPSPMDMPFLLRYALEGLAHIDTKHCKQIVVVPDGSLPDRGDSLRRVVEEFDDPRVELIPTRPLDYFLFRRMKPVGGAATHWMMVVIGVNHARCGHAFLHDADAFFLEPDGLERQYSECRGRGLSVLGVTPRWDPFFLEAGYSIPGTWELMFSTRWARSRSPYQLKNGWWPLPVPAGGYEFDSMLHPMYLDYPSGKVAVMDPPPKFVHFNGTIGAFRHYHHGHGKVDELFRLLLLAVLGELIPAGDGRRAVPEVAELVRGLTDPDAPITYGSDLAARQYPIFRAMLDELCESPIFRGERAEKVRALVAPFDEHFRDRGPAPAEAGEGAAAGLSFRIHPMG